MAKRNLKPMIKRLYIEEGLSDSDIALRLKCDRGTVYYHKKNDLKEGIDWDQLKSNRQFNQITSSENFEKDKKEFLTTLFNAFKKEKESIEKITDPAERISKLNAFANNYYKFLKPSVHDCKGIADKSSRVTLNIVIDFAMKYDQKELIDFLNDHFEEITSKTVDEVKKIK